MFQIGPDDKAGKQLWDQLWSAPLIHNAIDPHKTNVSNYVYRHFHQFFAPLLACSESGNMRLIEIGCGRSRWLPYFAREFGYQIAGIDYSEIGCHQARQILEEANIAGDIVCKDFFHPPSEMIEAFDVVVSLGVVEHFTDSAACVRALTRYLKPGGLIITTIPNLAGWIGDIQSVLDKSLYDAHLPLDKDQLSTAHTSADLAVQYCSYFMGFNWGILNATRGRNEGFIYRILRMIPAGISIPFWFGEELWKPMKPNRLTSPYIVCVARKPYKAATG